MCMSVVLTRVSAHHSVQCPEEGRGGCQVPWDWAGVTDGCESVCGYWECNLGPLEEHTFSHVAGLILRKHQSL